MNYTRETWEAGELDPAAKTQEVVDRLRMIGRFAEYVDTGAVDAADALLLARCLLEKAETLAA